MTVLKKLYKGLDWFSNLLNQISIYLIAVLLGTMSVVVFLQVVFRFCGRSLPWSGELARYMMIYMTYVGTAVAVRAKSHIAVEAAVGALPQKAQEVAELVVDILLLVLFYVLIVYGWKLVQITMAQKSPAIGFKMGTIYASIFISALLMTVHTFRNILGDLITIFTKDEGGAIQK